MNGSDKRPDTPSNGSTKPATPAPNSEEPQGPLDNLGREDVPHTEPVEEQIPLFTQEELDKAAEPAAVRLTGHELVWLARKIKGADTKAKELLKAHSGKGKHELTSSELAEFEIAQKFGQTLADNSQKLEALMDASLKRRQALRSRKADLEDILRFTDEAEVKAEATKEILALPDEDEAMVAAIAMDRPSVKFILAVVESEIDRIRTKVVPHYENAPEETFEGSHPRSYYVNKNQHMKIVLEMLATKLEKKL